MLPEEIKNLIETRLTDSKTFVEGDGAHFTATVISPAFIGKNRVQKQQLVYAAVEEQLLDGSLHALSLKTYTPEEWQTFNQDGPKSWKS